MNYTKTWRNYERERKISEVKPLGAGFAFIVLITVCLLKIAHFY